MYYLFKLSNFMSIELEQLQEVHHQCSNVDLIICQLVSRRRGEVFLALETSEEEDGEHGSVEDVSNLPLFMMIHKVVVVLVITRDVGFL